MHRCLQMSPFACYTNDKKLSNSNLSEQIKNYLPYAQKYVTSPDDIITLELADSLGQSTIARDALLHK